MKIRNYRNSDLSQVLNLHKVAMEIIGVYKGNGPWDNDLNDIEQYYQDGKFIIGEIDNTIISMGALRKITDEISEIKRMRTDPKYQGKGYGNQILNELIKYAKEMKFKDIILETSENQISAIKLYEKNGFKEFKKEVIDGFNCTWYRLDL